MHWCCSEQIKWWWSWWCRPRKHYLLLRGGNKWKDKAINNRASVYTQLRTFSITKPFPAQWWVQRNEGAASVLACVRPFRIFRTLKSETAGKIKYQSHIQKHLAFEGIPCREPYTMGSPVAMPWTSIGPLPQDTHHPLPTISGSALVPVYSFWRRCSNIMFPNVYPSSMPSHFHTSSSRLMLY